jgi:hypothetical protein
MPRVKNDSKALDRWMQKNGITGKDAPKFLKALAKKVGKNVTNIDVQVLAAVKNSCIPRSRGAQMSTELRTFLERAQAKDFISFFEEQATNPILRQLSSGA